jgi:hypothetical protein
VPSSTIVSGVWAKPATTARGKWQPQRLGRDGIVLHPAPKAGDDTFILAPTDRDVIGDQGELDVPGANNSTNQQGQRVQVPLVVTVAARVQGMRQGPFDGTIGLEADGHGLLQSSGLVTMTKGYHCASASIFPGGIPSHDNSLIFSVR